MQDVTRTTTEEKRDLIQLVKEIEVATESTNLLSMDPDTLSSLEWRLACICGALGTSRMAIEDPYREEHLGDEFGQAA